jgi:hypothetical protein
MAVISTTLLIDVVAQWWLLQSTSTASSVNATFAPLHACMLWLLLTEAHASVQIHQPEYAAGFNSLLNVGSPAPAAP